jgi:hypothetical protein
MYGNACETSCSRFTADNRPLVTQVGQTDTEIKVGASLRRTDSWETACSSPVNTSPRPA